MDRYAIESIPEESIAVYQVPGPPLMVKRCDFRPGAHGTVSSYHMLADSAGSSACRFMCRAVKKIIDCRELNALVRCRSFGKGSHPNIVKCYRWWKEGELYSFDMDQYETELFDLLSADGYVHHEERTKAVFRQLASALHHMHLCGVAHNDVKLENVLINTHATTEETTWTPVLIDLSCSTPAHQRLPRFVGSVPAAAPEVLRMGPPFDPRASDVWALGIVLHALVTGAFPWDAAVDSPKQRHRPGDERVLPTDPRFCAYSQNGTLVCADSFHPSMDDLSFPLLDSTGLHTPSANVSPNVTGFFFCVVCGRSAGGFTLGPPGSRGVGAPEQARGGHERGLQVQEYITLGLFLEPFLNKFERGIFNIFYLGRLESPLPRLKTAFFIIQTLQLFFQLVAIPAVFSLSLWVQIPIWVLDASLTRLTLGVLYALFGVAAFATLAAAVVSVVLGLVVTKDTGAAQWPLRIVRGFYFLLSWILFVPAFGIFLDVVDCTYRPGGVVTHDLFPTVACWALPHAVPSALSLLLILVFLVFAAGNALFVFPSAGFDSRSRGRFDLLVVRLPSPTSAPYAAQSLMPLPLRPSALSSAPTVVAQLLAKCLIVCAERVLTVHTVLRVVLIMASTGVVLVMLLWMLPYHTRLANMMFMGEYWVCFLAALEWSILHLALPQYADGWVPFVILMGASLNPQPPSLEGEKGGPSSPGFHFSSNNRFHLRRAADIRYTATLALNRADVRRLLSTIQPAVTPNTPGPRILCPPQLLPALLAACQISHIRMSALAPPPITPTAGEGTTASSAALEDGAQLLGGDLPSADAVVARCRWSLSVEWATRFLRWKETVGDARLQALAKAIYAKGTTKFPESHGLLLNYAEFLYVRPLPAMPTCPTCPSCGTYYHPWTPPTCISYSKISAALCSLRDHSHRLARVWAFLMRPHLDVQSLPPLLDSAVAHANTALEAYSSLIKSFPTNVPLLRAYGSLLQDLYGDTDLSDTLFIQADQLEEEKGGGGGTGGTDGESMAGHSVANTAKKGSLGRAPSVASRQTRSQMSLTMGEGGTGFDYRSVIAFLLRRHKGAAAHDASSEDGAEEVTGGCTPLRATTWAVFLLTVVTVAFLAGCLVILYTAVDASNDMGAILVGNSNCSVMVQKMAYVSRKIFESMMEGGTLRPDGSYNVDNFTLSAFWKPKVQGWVAKLTVLANTMNTIIQATGARGALREAWTVRPMPPSTPRVVTDFIPLPSSSRLPGISLAPLAGQTWEYPVALPVVSEGVLTTINFATANLWALAEDMIGKSRHVGLSGIAQLDPGQHETSPFYTGACALLFFLGGVLINYLSLRYVARERRGVMAFYTNLPRDVVRAEYARLKKNKEAEETGPHPASPPAANRGCAAAGGDELRGTNTPDCRPARAASADAPPQTLEEVDDEASGDMVAPPSLVPPRGAGTASPARRSPVLGSAVTSSPVVPDDEGTEGGDVVAPSPVSMAVPATPLMAPGPLPLGPDLHKRMQVSLEDLPTSSDEDADGGSPESRRRGHPSLRHPSATGAVGGLPATASIPENPLASLLAMTQASQQAASASLLPPLSDRANQVDEQEEEGRPTVASLTTAPVPKLSSGEAADSEKDGGGAEGEDEGEEKSEARLEAESKRKEAVRKLPATAVISKNLIIRLTVAVVFSTFFILGTGFVGYSQASSVTPFFGQVAAYGARGAQLAQTNVLVYQLIYNHTIAYSPFAGVDPAVVARVRYLSVSTHPGRDSSYLLSVA
ncbi:putative Protein kinase domain [Paratrimastix pyriformis]|uniref:Protein kinase domain-containing protein n=1 Tax=Paratrimastix pyriformis TaxID=342808 RepID=A0ABQ8UR62_9EUKA|nr:putative Protein kinase domain [Paratrimastix pyriformis]